MSKQDVIDYVMETPHNTNRAVLEGLVDTAVKSQVQADWDQNDETAKDYIKNRICYDNPVSIFATINSSNIYITNSLTNEDLNTFSDWCTGASLVNLKINNTVYTLQPGGFADGVYTLNYNNTAAITRNIRGTADYLGIKDGFPVEKTAGLNFTLYVEEIKQIDKKYIPDELFTQANWNENNETSPAYIQNRICYEEETVTELGNTAEVWVSLVGEEASTSVLKLLDIPISYKIKGILYENQKPSKMESYVMYYGERYGENPEYVMISTYSPHNMSFNGMEASDFQFVKIENTVKQIDSKFIYTLDTIAEPVDEAKIPINSKAVMSILNELMNLIPKNFVGVQDQNFNENQKQIARNNIGIKNPFKVTFTRDRGKVYANKTAKEIKDAANNEQFVYGIYGTAIYYLNTDDNLDSLRFTRLYTETTDSSRFSGLCYSVFYVNNPSDNFTGNYEENYCYNITNPSIKVVKVKLDNGIYKFDSTGAATGYNEIYDMCTTGNGNNYTNSDVFISYGGNKLYKLDQNPWSITNPLVFKRVSYDSTTSSILFETFTVNTDSTITYESNVFEQSSTQSDWNQNDTSASDYIKNKPTIDTALSSTSENVVQNKVVKAAIDEVQNTVKEYIGSKVSDKELILFSSTENSTKKFKITVNDSGTISAKEVTESA